jgi:hypothetical protein
MAKIGDALRDENRKVAALTKKTDDETRVSVGGKLVNTWHPFEMENDGASFHKPIKIKYCLSEERREMLKVE